MTMQALGDTLCAKFRAAPWGAGDADTQKQRLLLSVPMDQFFAAAEAAKAALVNCRMLFATATYVEKDLYWIVELLAQDGAQLSLRVAVKDPKAVLPSLSALWDHADWQEHEAHELFGLHFAGCPETEPFLLRASRKQFPHRRQ